LGIVESPLDDATKLPLSELRKLQLCDFMARIWLEYTSTNAGFQFLQESSQRRDWYRDYPHFKRAKGLGIRREERSLGLTVWQMLLPHTSGMGRLQCQKRPRVNHPTRQVAQPKEDDTAVSMGFLK
jgi:hypothetical protein